MSVPFHNPSVSRADGPAVGTSNAVAAQWQQERYGGARLQHMAACASMTDTGNHAAGVIWNPSMEDPDGVSARGSHASQMVEKREDEERVIAQPGLAEDVTQGDETTYEEVMPEQLLPPPGFQPFFTLVEDHETGEHYHPTVQYVFTDDDPEDLTAGLLHAIEQQTGQAEVEERIVILDMLSDGKTVQVASSLSPHWQSLQASISQAPSWGGTSTDDQGRLMIRTSIRQHR
ncbi:hypothetical protein LTR78_004905 [Recurvomyces mirabilis]|uniref:Uncharacterized protein n=1 Tax=Recurvomyces mirabilis TaxID=574656 RepID=A0AAE1C2A4_9PEZI|nr:hypothetical protein LTR78_004905 [Recurvomyces mirabilis]KAK5158075.1 hypothetical protein LTS14_003998 [Recurvomyces mirabilis]